MTDQRPGYGEEKEKASKRQFNNALAISAIIGIIIAAALKYAQGDSGSIFTASPDTMSISPALAIGLTILVLAGFIVFPVLGLFRMDELERGHNVNASALAGLYGITAFPAWHLLSLGGLLPAPTAVGLFLIIFCGGFLSYLFLKYRH